MRRDGASGIGRRFGGGGSDTSGYSLSPTGIFRGISFAARVRSVLRIRGVRFGNRVDGSAAFPRGARMGRAPYLDGDVGGGLHLPTGG